MKGKVQESNPDIEQAAQKLANNEFVVVPGHKIKEYKDLVPRSLHPKLESMTFGLTADHFVAMVHRTDAGDAPKTVNVDVYLWAYNATSNELATTGLLVNRAGETVWHHLEPKEEFARDLSYLDIGATANNIFLSGDKLGIIPRGALHDALQYKRVKFDS